MMSHPGSAIVGCLCILVALMKDPSEYFGEGLFGKKIIRYQFLNAALYGLGFGNILIGFS